MRYSLAPVALAALVAANPVPQGVTESIAPEESTPSGCQTSYDGEFNIQITNVSDSSAKRSIHKRQAIVLSMTLADGVLTDSEDRTGYIAANNQFQFDAPPQTGAIYTSGWSVCENGHLALGEEEIFYSCLSGDFYNLYDENNAAQCNEVYINVVAGGSGAAGVQPDGQPTGSAVASQIPDGQITAQPVSSAAATQIPDGQIQATPVSSVVAPVSQIPDGQIQATPAPTSAVVSQIPDGQIQAPTSAVVSQIADGQIQAPTASAPVVSQIPDGQIQAPSGTGMMPVANGTMAYPSVPVQSVGAASGLIAPGFGLLAAIFGIAAL